MRVFNLTATNIDYRGKVLAPGSSQEYQDLVNVPARDRALEQKRILAFGVLPSWWVSQQNEKLQPRAAPVDHTPKKRK